LVIELAKQYKQKEAEMQEFQRELDA